MYFFPLLGNKRKTVPPMHVVSHSFSGTKLDWCNQLSYFDKEHTVFYNFLLDKNLLLKSYIYTSICGNDWSYVASTLHHINRKFSQKTPPWLFG